MGQSPIRNTGGQGPSRAGQVRTVCTVHCRMSHLKNYNKSLRVSWLWVGPQTHVHKITNVPVFYMALGLVI